MKKAFRDYLFTDYLFQLSMYQKLTIDIELFTKTRKKDLQSGYDFDDCLDVYETRYSEDFQHFLNFFKWNEKFYGYCPFCKRENTLEPSGDELIEKFSKSSLYAVREDQEDYYDEGNVIARNEMLDRLKVFEKNKFIVKEVKCPHNFDHQFMFLYQVKLKEKQNRYELEFQKIGQSPSMSDFARLNISRHEKLMKEFDCIDDFVMATHMNGSGTGVAAYTYLRRVFEKLIYRVFNDKQSVLGKTESEFREMTMKNKIILLKDFLPDFLTNNNPNIYGLLSSGIHELSEDEASLMFPVLETAILIIFKEKQAKIDDDILKQKTHNALNNFATKINSK